MSECPRAEVIRDTSYDRATTIAYQAVFIPVINSMFAVSLAALPDMVTRQILSGVSPVTAAHYQIVVMCMILGSRGLSTAFFLVLTESIFVKNTTI